MDIVSQSLRSCKKSPHFVEGRKKAKWPHCGGSERKIESTSPVSGEVTLSVRQAL